MNRRATVGGAIIIAWLAGLALLVRRELFRPQIERLAQAAMRVTPGAVFYGVMQGDRQVGFASSTIDTAETSITVTDYLVADLPVGGKTRRTTARSTTVLSRALRMRTFEVELAGENAPLHATGTVDGDSVLTLQLETNGIKGEPQRIPLTGPVLLPTVVPLALVLGESPEVGRRYTLPVFDPTTMRPRDAGIDVKAESLFIMHDSAAFDAATRTWHGILPDTIRAWRIDGGAAASLGGWVDEQGRIVSTELLGFSLARLPYEVAFENWRNDSTHLVVSDDRDILETTAIVANKRMDRRVDALRVRLSGVDLAGFDLSGGRQTLAGSELAVHALPAGALEARWSLPRRPPGVDTKYLAAEPLIQSKDDDLFLLAYRVQNFQHDPRVVAEQLNRWVHDSIAARPAFGIPNALEVLRTRAGDCNEHTQLYVAMARAVGIPARVASGLAYVDGKFYYHAWPEVFLGDWVGVDPTFGQFPADAAHLRFTIGGLDRQTSLLRLMGNLKIDVLEVNGATRPDAMR